MRVFWKITHENSESHLLLDKKVEVKQKIRIISPGVSHFEVGLNDYVISEKQLLLPSVPTEIKQVKKYNIKSKYKHNTPSIGFHHVK